MANILRCYQARIWLLAMSGVLLTAGCEKSSAVPSIENRETAAAVEASVVLSVKPAENRSIERTVTALGRCDALPSKMALVAPLIEGRVAEILARRGDKVPRGQPIVQLDTTLAQADLTEKQAARDSLIASLRALTSVPRSEEQRTSKLAIDEAGIALTRAQALLDRLRPLREHNEVPEAQVFEADEAVKQARVQKQTAQARFDLLMLRPREELIAEAQTKIEMAEAAVKTAQARIDLHTIRAPIDGILDSLNCRLGETVAVGAPIASVVDDQDVLAVAWLPIGQIAKIEIGQNARVYPSIPPSTLKNKDAFPKAIEGRVAYIGRSTDAQTGNVPLHVHVENRHGEFIVGQTLSLEIVVEAPVPRLCVPLDAVHDEGEGAAVTVVRDGKAVVLHPQLGTSDSGWIAVTETDLREGEPVAVAGAYNLPNGTPVTAEVAQ
jgi:RND family efflux transporter MFP subunit